MGLGAVMHAKVKMGHYFVLIVAQALTLDARVSGVAPWLPGCHL